MAVIGTDEDQNDPNGAAGTPAGGGSAVPNVGGAGGGGYIGGGTGQGATTTSAAPTSSGSFTNLSNYLSANQGGGDQMGKAVNDVVNTAGKVTDKARGTYQGEGVDAAKAGTVNVDQGVINKISGGASKVDPTLMASIKNGFDDKTGKYSGPGSVPENTNYSGPASYAAGTYSGPQDATSMSGQAATDRASYQGLANTLAGNLKNANGGQAGVGALEKNIYQQPSYTAGENNLDAFLTGGSGAYQNSLKNMNSAWGGETDKGTAADKAVNDAAAAGKQTSVDTQNAYNTAISAAQAQSSETQNALGGAIKDQLAKQSAWRPPPPPLVTAPAPTMGVTSVDAAMAPGGGKNGAGPNAFGAGAAIAKGVKDTSPGQVNKAIAGSGAAGAGTPIQGPSTDPGGSWQQLQNVLTQAAKPPSVPNLPSKPKFKNPF